MKAVIVIRPNSEFSRSMDELSGRISGEVKYVNPDTAEGADFCRAHDVVAYPTILILADDSSEHYRATENFSVDEINYHLTKTL